MIIFRIEIKFLLSDINLLQSRIQSTKLVKFSKFHTDSILIRVSHLCRIEQSRNRQASIIFIFVYYLSWLSITIFPVIFFFVSKQPHRSQGLELSQVAVTRVLHHVAPRFAPRCTSCGDSRGNAVVRISGSRPPLHFPSFDLQFTVTHASIS